MLTRIQNLILESVRDNIISRPSGPSTPNVSFANSTFEITPFAFDANGVDTTSIQANFRDVSNNPLENISGTLSSSSIRVSKSLSQISSNKTIPAADGVDETTIFISLKKLSIPTLSEPAPVPNVPASQIVVSISGAGNTITQAVTDADNNGQATLKYVSTVAEPKNITVTVAGLLLNTVLTIDQGGSIVPPAPGDPDFEDSFAGLQRNNANGFTWGSGGTRVTVVSFDGYDCLRFRYGPDADGADSTAEQRWALAEYVTQLYVEFYIYLGSNFVHRTQSGSNNNKFYQIWRDIYSDVGTGTLQFGTEYETSSGITPNSAIRLMARRENFNSVSSADPFGDYAPTGQGATFFSSLGPIAPGSWHKVQIRLKVASASGMADGIQKILIDDVLFASITNGKFWNYPASGSTPADTLLKNGYFMGWSNSGFLDETFVYIRDVKFWYNDNDPGWG